jgi:apoptosis-inducing factor 3
VGHAETWDELKIDGDVAAKDCRVSYLKAGKLMAVATIGRDAESLRAEFDLERR